jgi:hypothetical protein
VEDVTLGPGNLAGIGVYAARDFAAGEVVVTYHLQPLDAVDYAALPAGENLFVHSFGGRRYLYPAPARFVNHSDDPSCYQDFDRSCNIALRRIAHGEPITIDANQETARELGTFLDAYQHALHERSMPLLAALIDHDTTLWVHGQAFRGRDAVIAALRHSSPGPLSATQWLVGTGRWEALCSAETEITDGRRHLTMLIKVVEGNWQVVYQHAG